MRLVHSVPLANGSTTFFLPKSQIGNIIVEYTPVAAAAVTLVRADYGTAILNWNGRDVVNTDVEILNLLDNIYGGVAEFTPAVAALSRLTMVIPCGQWFDPLNVYDIGEKDQVSIKLNFGNLASAAFVASGSCNIYIKTKIGVMNYLHNIIARPVVVAGASTLADTYPVNNISQVYLKAPTILTRAQIMKDGETIVDAPTASINAYSDWIHLLETTNTTIAIEFGESKDIRENLGSQVQYQYTFSGAGTLNQYFSFIEFTPNKAAESKARAASKLARQAGNTAQPQL